MHHSLVTKLRNDLAALRMAKEADAECCLFHHLRQTIPAKGAWKVLARKHAKRTGYYIDIIVFKGHHAKIAVEIKWNRKQIAAKDRKSLDYALARLCVQRAYFVSVGPDLSNCKKIAGKSVLKKYRLHEIPIYLSFHKK